MGDRTQLLAIVLASRFRAPIPILFGILVATIANHLLAGLVGFYLADVLSATWFKYAVSLSFIAMAIWTLIPDNADDLETDRLHLGVFLTTASTFFLVEMGDKTQIATAALAAHFHNIAVVVAGTTTGMMLANIPAVLFGHAATRIIPMTYLRWGAAAVYLCLGLWAFSTTAGWLH
ncbi:MAG: TMEM165/GDT1 family protein [Alphaproteobacteria bacterium]|nr:TMEM165/GDT1 family protein [Alphaproteobacteria bacterium]